MLHVAVTVLALCTAVHVEEMLKSMTLRQKVGQMTQVGIGFLMEKDGVTLNVSQVTSFIQDYGIGSVFDTPFSRGSRQGKRAFSRDEWRSLIHQLQGASASSETGIPILYGLDSVHGANYVRGATILPQQINLGATFNDKLVERAAAIQAKDTRMSGIPWVFSPILGITMQMSWPRVYETFGEDPMLVSVLGSSMIRGMQGFPARLKDATKTAACMKHFIGYPFPLNGQDRTPSWIPERVLRQYFFPSFESAVKQGVASAMEAYNDVNGIPMVSSNHLLKQVLRDEMDFDGVLVTDYSEINNLHSWHHVAASKREATSIALKQTSIDMSMVPDSMQFAEDLVDLVQKGALPESRIDESVRKILQLKDDLGLFENPLGYDDQFSAEVVGSTQDQLVALEAARESIVLVENRDHVLPLSRDKPATVVVVGAAGNSTGILSGGWTTFWQGSEDNVLGQGTSILVSLQSLTSNSTHHVRFSPGCEACSDEDIAMIQRDVQDADIVVFCTGEKPYAEKSGNIQDIRIDEHQKRLFDAVASLGKKIILVLVEGRPRVLGSMADTAEAVLVAMLPGPQGGQAIAEIILGLTNPSGRLPFSYPRHTNGGPSPYWHAISSDDTYDPQWEFGHGRSYSPFVYSDLFVSANSFDVHDTLTVGVSVANHGRMAGKETMMLFMRDLYRSVTPEAKLLKRFEKVFLEPGEEYKAEFQLTADDFSFVDQYQKRICEDGTFNVTVGGLKSLVNLTGCQSYHYSTTASSAAAEIAQFPVATMTILCFASFACGIISMFAFYRMQSRAKTDVYTELLPEGHSVAL